MAATGSTPMAGLPPLVTSPDRRRPRGVESGGRHSTHRQGREAAEDSVRGNRPSHLATCRFYPRWMAVVATLQSQQQELVSGTVTFCGKGAATSEQLR
jgi:hypothetical protein